MDSILEDIDDEVEDLDEEEAREAYLALLSSSFPFVLVPPLFNRKGDLPDLNWTRVKYTEHAGHDFPEHQGVYMFAISVEDDNLPPNSYIMYAGKAGDVTSNNTIANRFRDYVNKSGYYNRSRVKKLIKHYSDYLYYYYAEIPNGDSTSDVEQTLADILTPPCCKRDFSATVRTLLRGAGING
ncbi:hypothetical protein [Vibrio alginolyticus]|uniref:hypothetical protein n=1 Tax=Vibrio alginolyticus TaxID=663 RepID=UPI00374A658D